MKYIILLASVASMALSACSVTGTDSKAEFGCLAPEGVQCMTASGVYYNSLANNLPAQRANKTAAAEKTSAAERAREAPAATLVQAQPVALPQHVHATVGKRAPDFAAAGAVRSAPRIMRVWVLPWEDSDGDLHDQSYLYMTLDSGRWLIEHTRAAVQGRSRQMSGTTLLFGDAALGTESVVTAPDARSGFARDMQKLAPAKREADNE
jgi:conjugal transfer pilus assembly protein TraV